VNSFNHDDLDDPLPDLGKPGPQFLPRAPLPAAAAFAPAVERVFTEPCSKCRGSGQWRPGYACFACKGTGKLQFKTSAEDRAKARGYAAKKAAAREQDKATWRVEHKAELDWLAAAANRQEWLASQGKPTWDFPVKLRESLGQYGTLTDGQVEALRKCMARDAERAAQKAADAEKRSVAIDIAKIEEAFATARAKADRRGARGIWMRPLTLRSGETDVTFNPGKPGGKWEGIIFAKSGERQLGRIQGGKYSPAFSCTEAEKSAVVDCASDPHKAAKAYGKAWSICTICGQTLTNDESIARGIGPICAEKYGW
jgi:hypothetical protein